MRIAQEPLNEAEATRVSDLLVDSGGRPLAFARGVFAATASAPTQLDPSQWLPMLLGEEVPNAGVLKELLALLIRDYNSCADCLALGIPAVPHPSEIEDVGEFCKGFVQIAQRDKSWTKDQEAFLLTVPMMTLSGYAETDSLRSLEPRIGQSFTQYQKESRESLSDDVAAVFAHFAEKRAKATTDAQEKIKTDAREKMGRNEPCSCGSGRKFKKCCGLLS